MSQNKMHRDASGDTALPSAGNTSIGLEPAVIARKRASRDETTVARLNDRFQVVSEGGSDPRQWLLQRRSGTHGSTSISFCTSRTGLLLAIREKCVRPEDFARRHDYPGLVPAAIAIIGMLPVQFPRKGSIA